MGNIRDVNTDKILRAAVELFAKKGYSATTIDDIAKLTELPKANIHYYFKSKQVLYEAALTANLEHPSRGDIILAARHSLDRGEYRDAIKQLETYCDLYDMG